MEPQIIFPLMLFATALLGLFGFSIAALHQYMIDQNRKKKSKARKAPTRQRMSRVS